ncbi:MAG: hypothetical protein EOO88_33710 [Pedobacter sp.]|nr:MAG: hypothetical protein EOO88_33710 [Pedobacter sp.]
MKTLLHRSGIMILLLSSVIIGCKKKDVPNTAPQVSTTGMSAVTGTTATGGGSISSDGGAAVTISGLCYSKTNQTPTISDDTTKTTTTSGSFSSMLKNLQPSAIYYVRAYATNSMGTGYGAVVSFTTGNGAPTATGVSVTGIARVGEELTAAYTYSDPENNPQSGTTFQWYIATTATGTGEAAIAGATTSKYQVKAADEFKFIRVSITPKSSAGTADGAEVRSAYVGPLDVESVTFTYNGQQVTYGVIISSKTGRKWLDRNIGAERVAQSFQDYKAYGDLFQWGRSADGHQLITWTDFDKGIPVSGTTLTRSTSDIVSNSSFIVTEILPFDWRNPQNDNLWQTPVNNNAVCPVGWRIPTIDEWTNEDISDMEIGFNRLKLTAPSDRGFSSGNLSVPGLAGTYWGSTISSANPARVTAITIYKPGVSGGGINPVARRSNGYSVRCIKDQ